MAIKTVGVLGCGLMGAGIAQVSAAAGFKTIVQPVASAGASFQLAISSGKFQGMIWPTTPSGSWKW